MPGEDIYSWSATAASNGSADTSINWAEGMPRASVNDSARSMMAAHAKWLKYTRGTIATTGAANAQAFSSGEAYTTVPTGMRVTLQIGPGLTNTGATTLNMDGIGAVAVVSPTGVALTGGELVAGAYSEFLYNGTNWIIANSSGMFVSKSGDTMRGNLTISNPGGALGLAPSGSTKVGSLSQSADVLSLGATGVANYYNLNLNTGTSAFAGDVWISKVTPMLVLGKASGENAIIEGINRTGSSRRWQLVLGNSSLETGGNVGSDFQLTAFSDVDAALNTAIFIRRTDSAMTLGGLINATPITSAQVSVGCSNGAFGIAIRNTAAGATNYPMQFSNWVGTQVGFISADDSTTTYSTTSDVRLKRDVAPFTQGRATLDQIEIIEFDWVTGGEHSVGVSAQQAQAAYPPAVQAGQGEPGEDGFRPWGVDYSKYVGLLIQAVQDAHARIDALEQRIAALEAA